MITLDIMLGPDAGRQFPLGTEPAIIGRDADADIRLPSPAVSRRHARIVWLDGGYYVEDLGSRNGSFLNDKKLEGRKPLAEGDQLRIGEYTLILVQPTSFNTLVETEMKVRERVEAALSNVGLYALNPGRKLQIVLELARSLSVTLELEPLLVRVLDHLLTLFPQADRGMVLLVEDKHLAVRAQRTRDPSTRGDFPYSRTIVNQALKDGVGILSQDPSADERFTSSSTVSAMQARSLLCVPLIDHENTRLGVVQLLCTRQGMSFAAEDLYLLTTLALLVSMVLENVELNARRLQEAQLRRELAMASEIQQGFLPNNFTPLPGGGYELFARVCPARDVSGDLYDFFPTPDGRLVFFVGDVSGKGMPAALFMFSVRSLSRHLALAGGSPMLTLDRLNTALALDNPSALFVTVIHGVYDPRTGEVVLASGGHPMPLLRRADGQVEDFRLPNGRLLGYMEGSVNMADTRLKLAPGETLILYTDGFTEAFAPDGRTMFGVERLRQALGGKRTSLSLEACAEKVRVGVEQFMGSSELQDDLTILMLRRT